MEKIQGVIFLVVVSCALLTSDSGDRPDCFHDQVATLLTSVSASKDRVSSLSGVLRAVEDTLNTVWPGSKVNLFGSLSTGLGSPASDADISVSLPGGLYPGNDVITRARAAFEASPHIYQQIHTRSRLPAITLRYAPVNITCDIHFRVEPFETIESSLLHYLLHIDERALKLAIIVKYWAKLHKLICPKYLTSYGMMMLVIFFLQQRAVLPSVVDLQNDIPAHISNGSHCYNVAAEKQNVVSKDSESLYEILGAFFEYYNHFNFDRFIVSPYSGQSVDKSLFEDLRSVPDKFQLYKVNVANNITKPFNITALNIQSLLILNDNCAWRVESTEWFQANFESAAKSYRENEKCSFLKAVDVID